MIAIASIALDAVVPIKEQHKRDLTEFEHVELSGEGGTWEAAKQAVALPENAVVLSWRQA